MPAPALIELAAGPIDGVNLIFTSSADYAPGSLQVWLNGLVQRPGAWTELGLNQIRLVEAPRSGDVVQVFYRPL